MKTATHSTPRPRYPHGPEKSRRKLPESAECRYCHARLIAGEWTWGGPRPRNSRPVVCEACWRAKNGEPAGTVVITGPLPEERKSELVRLCLNEEKLENAEHPLNRIMTVERKPDSIRIATTDLHLPHRLGRALHRAFKAKVVESYDTANKSIRIICRLGD